MKALGISRSIEFSPNSENKDSFILHAVGDVLQQKGMDVSYLTENEFLSSSIEGMDLIFTMGRDARTVKCLEKFEKKGILVVNPATGIRNSERFRLSELFLKERIPIPRTKLLESILEQADVTWPYPVWIKRGDGCAQVKDDVQLCGNAIEANAALAGFRRRGIERAVVSEHLKGDLVKFYGVLGTPFFSWNHPDFSKSKFGLEEKNGPVQGYRFNVEKMKEVCDKAADILQIPVYGGDCIVAADGTFKIIDFNDWPSFSSCRDEAAHAIASYIIKTYERNKKRPEFNT